MSLSTPDVIRTLQRKLYGKAKVEPDYRFYLLYDAAYADLPGDDPRPRVRPKMQLQDLSYPSHGQSLPRHPPTPSIAMADWTTDEH